MNINTLKFLLITIVFFAGCATNNGGQTRTKMLIEKYITLIKKLINILQNQLLKPILSLHQNSFKRYKEFYIQP